MSKMTAEEFLEKHGELLLHALDYFEGRMTEKAAEYQTMNRMYPKILDYEDEFVRHNDMRDKIRAVHRELWKIVES